MNYTKTASYFKSSNGTTNISYYLYEPVGTTRGLLQISHGMCEYIERYEEFIDYLTGHGILVCGNDHLGHGNSINSMDDLGYFAEDKGWQCLILDLKTLTDLIQDKYPNLPTFILGHSMGSFALRAYLSDYGSQLTGAIISGTGGINSIAGIGEFLITNINKRKGSHFRSETFNRIFFNGFNKYFPNEDSPFAWLTRDKSIVDKYAQDKKCNFIFTNNGFLNLIKMQRLVTSKTWANTVPKNLPIHFISGDKDPVGTYGKGVQNTYNQLLEAKVSPVTINLYKDGRHEILNEQNRKEVYEDVLNWINQHI